jgi:hypothetical protein
MEQKIPINHLFAVLLFKPMLKREEGRGRELVLSLNRRED